MEQEIWKDIIGFEKLYQVSNLGRIKSLEREEICNRIKTIYRRYRKEIILKPFCSTNSPYPFVLLRNNNKTNNIRIHRLVAKAFIPRVENKFYINHKDGDKTNNRVENLEWCTQKENVQHSWKTGLSKFKHNKQYYIDKKNVETQRINKLIILQYDLVGNFIREWKNQIECAKYYKTSKQNINRAIRNNSIACGFKWKKNI